MPAHDILAQCGGQPSQMRGAVSPIRPSAAVALVDASRKLHLHRDGAVLRMVNTLGLAVYPVITVDGEIVSMGPPVIDELAPLLRGRLGGHDE